MKKLRNIPRYQHTEDSPITEYWDDGPIRHEQEYEDIPYVREKIPTIDAQPATVDYPDTQAGVGFLVSGPLGAGLGRGRHFNTVEDAMAWAVKKYPKAKVRNRTKGEFRWILQVIK